MIHQWIYLIQSHYRMKSIKGIGKIEKKKYKNNPKIKGTFEVTFESAFIMLKIRS